MIQGEKRYKYKVIKSGDDIEVYEYETSQYKTEPKEKVETECEVEEIKDETIKQDDVIDGNYHRNLQNIKRKKQYVRRLIAANAFQYEEKDKFITLTFRGEESPTRQELIDSFDLFRRRLREKYPDFLYFAIMERGTHGTERLHFHTLFFNLPYIPQKEFMEIWKNGGVNIQAPDTYYDLVGYLVKYVEKTIDDGTLIPKGKKFYFTSRGLKRPKEYFLSDDELEEFLAKNQMEEKQVVYDTDFESERVGKCHYSKYTKQRDVKPRIPTFENEDDLYYYISMLEEHETYNTHE